MTDQSIVLQVTIDDQRARLTGVIREIRQSRNQAFDLVYRDLQGNPGYDEERAARRRLAEIDRHYREAEQPYVAELVKISSMIARPGYIELTALTPEQHARISDEISRIAAPQAVADSAIARHKAEGASEGPPNAEGVSTNHPGDES